MSRESTRRKGNLFARLAGGGKEAENQFVVQQRIDGLLLWSEDTDWQQEMRRLLAEFDNGNLGKDDEILRLRELLSRQANWAESSYLDGIAGDERWARAVEALDKVELPEL